MKNLQKTDLGESRSLQIKVTFFIVLIAFLIRVIRLDVPHDWSFDEVYHALSAEAYALNDPRGYEWWNASPKDLAYEWLHPPIGKLLMAASIKLFAKPYIPESKSATVDGRTTFAWRFPGTIFAAFTVWLLIIFGSKLFNNFWIGAVAGGLYALDGLSFVQSRTGMNDIFVTFFVVLVFYRIYLLISQYQQGFFKNLWWLGIATGLAASTKWTGFYAVGIAFLWGVVYILKKELSYSSSPSADGSRSFQNSSRNSPFARIIMRVGTSVIYLGFLPVLVYFLSYGQWWIQGHTWSQFEELHKQIWWYQTGLKATHGYQSQALTWPFLYRPVWFYVKYEDVVKNGVKTLYIGNIYTMGHPFIWWAGLGGIFWVIWMFLKGIWEKIQSIGKSIPHYSLSERSESKGFLSKSSTRLHLPDARASGGQAGSDNKILAFSIIIVGYFGMFLPWAFSPRIMFMYHYLPSVPFLCLALAYGLFQLKKSKWGKIFVTCYLSLVVIGFIYFYPHWSALPLPQSWVDKYYWLPSWK